MTREKVHLEPDIQRASMSVGRCVVAVSVPLSSPGVPSKYEGCVQLPAARDFAYWAMRSRLPCLVFLLLILGRGIFKTSTGI